MCIKPYILGVKIVPTSNTSFYFSLNKFYSLSNLCHLSTGWLFCLFLGQSSERVYIPQQLVSVNMSLCSPPVTAQRFSRLRVWQQMDTSGTEARRTLRLSSLLCFLPAAYRRGQGGDDSNRNMGLLKSTVVCKPPINHRTR